tara:strand:+ start:186 stop:293 length:108 start_codon:yes stop_codon:yes gene_type:complete
VDLAVVVHRAAVVVAHWMERVLMERVEEMAELEQV